MIINLFVAIKLMLFIKENKDKQRKHGEDGKKKRRLLWQILYQLL